MSLTVEVGSGVTGANSYNSLASADSYFELRGNSDWSDGSDDDKEASLIKGCQLMELFDWVGTKTDSTYPLEWPRRGVTDKNGFYISATGIPMQVKWIQMELALRYLTGTDPLPDQSSSGNIVREKVDVIEIEYERGGASQVPSLPYIDTLLRNWIRSRVAVEIVRA
jgi:hypothetical protein